AFVGAGALHSAYLAKELDIPHVIIPSQPGVGGALGCLLVDFRHDLSQTYVKRVNETTEEELEKKFLEMEAEATDLLKKEGIKDEDMQLIRHIEMRYEGQWRSLDVVVGKPLFSLEQAMAKFHDEHERAYAFSNPNINVEIYGLGIEAI